MGRGTRAGAAGGGGSSTRRAAAEGEDGGAAVEGEAGGGGGAAAAVGGSGAAAGSSRPGGGGWKMRPWSRAAPTSRREGEEGKRGPEIRLTLAQGRRFYLGASGEQAGGARRRGRWSRLTRRASRKKGKEGRGQRADCLSRSGCLSHKVARWLMPDGGRDDHGGGELSGCCPARARRAATATTVQLRRRWRGQERKLEPSTGAMDTRLATATTGL